MNYRPSARVLTHMRDYAHEYAHAYEQANGGTTDGGGHTYGRKHGNQMTNDNQSITMRVKIFSSIFEHVILKSLGKKRYFLFVINYTL